MKVKELLSVYEDHEYCDVVILDGNTPYCNGYGEDNILAEYDHKDFDHWYYGQLSYLSPIDEAINPLVKWFDYNVKSFSVINDFNLNGIQCMYITI